MLCGGASALVQAGFETLVEAGYQPEMAYFECLHELKLICDLIYQSGSPACVSPISDTAKYGDITRGPRVIDGRTKKEMKRILREIQSGQFTREWVNEYKGGLKNYSKLLAAGEKHPIEKTGQRLRGDDALDDQEEHQGRPGQLLRKQGTRPRHPPRARSRSPRRSWPPRTCAARLGVRRRAPEDRDHRATGRPSGRSKNRAARDSSPRSWSRRSLRGEADLAVHSAKDLPGDIAGAWRSRATCPAPTPGTSWSCGRA